MITVPAPEDFDAWRDCARDLIARGVPPAEVVWLHDGAPELFTNLPSSLSMPAASSPPDVPTAFTPTRVSNGRAPRAGGGTSTPAPARVPAAFVNVARVVAAHADPARWARLYRVLWRLTHGEPHLLDVTSDPDIHPLVLHERAVRKEVHKAHAFVRFRAVPAPELGAGGERYVAWHEPLHDVLPLAAPFFARRFTSMHWSILSPRRSVHWDRETLRLGPGVPRDAAPTDDALEPLWRTYYAHIFNPARVKVDAMLREMPRRYWKNLPEAGVIDDLLAQAAPRTDAMLAASREKSGEVRD